MRLRFLVFGLAAVFGTDSFPATASAEVQRNTESRESRIRVGNTSLYIRTIGQGPPAIVLHGGPDFDHGYLLPELDRLKDLFRLIYYDQRGRGRSARDVRPDEITLASDLNDLDRVRQHFGVESPVLIGHSWGAVLALEYALKYPRRVSLLILLNPAPASASDAAVTREAHKKKLGKNMKPRTEIVASRAYLEGDPDAVAAYYRIHFKPGLWRPKHYDALMARMEAGFDRQGKDGVLKARQIEARLMRDTWAMPGYDLMPKLRSLRIPALVIAGAKDFIPVDVARHIAQAIPDAKLIALKNCGHFAYLECPSAMRSAVMNFVRSTQQHKLSRDRAHP